MPIIRAEIVGTRMAENGSGGYTVNTTSYSVLVFHENGEVNLVEGDAKSIGPYLRYMRPQNDTDKLQILLEKMEEKLKRDFDKVIEQNIEKVFNTAYPIPKVQGKKYKEAIEELEKNGFVVEIKNPRHVPDENDIVDECSRKFETMRTVLIRLIPDVRGLTLEAVIQKLSDGMFNVVAKGTYNEDESDKKVISVGFKEGSDYDIIVIYNDLSLTGGESPEEGFINIIDSFQSVEAIYDLWEKYNLASRYKNIDVYIKMKLDAEKKNGHLNNMDQIKDAIVQLLKKEINK